MLTIHACGRSPHHPMRMTRIRWRQTRLWGMRASKVNAVDAGRIGREVYTYLYPLVTMEMTRRQMTNSAAGQRAGRGPMNQFVHIRAFPSADFRVVVRPNFDTLYSSAWLDLSGGPLVVSAPDTDGRYYLLPMYDMWTDAFAVPGWRTSGTQEAHWAVLPPGWTGEIPEGIRPIPAPTPTVWIIGRTKTDGPADYEAVHAVQDGFTITPLSAWPGQAPPAPFAPDPAVDDETEPLRQVHAMSAHDFFTLGAQLMRTHPPHATDFSVVERARRIGVVPGEPFDPSALDAAALAALESVPADVVQRLEAMMPTMARVANGWVMNTDSMGVYGNSYLKRAIIAMAGLGANQAEDAIYPLQITASDGKPAHGSKRYVVHFPAGALPPVDAFWSITLYDDDGFQVGNPIDRYAIGDRDPLTFNPDGSLDIWVQHNDPGEDRTGNWLPAPADGFSLCLRLYAPHPDALDGGWNPPPLAVR
jgi:hypothetical protein